MVSALLKHNTSLDQPCVKRWSAMHEAAKQGRKDIIALLLNNGGNVHLKDGFGVTPLGVAAEYGHCDVLEHLIHKGMWKGIACCLCFSWASQVAQWQRICLPRQETQVRYVGQKIPWRRKWQPSPVFLPGKSHG